MHAPAAALPAPPATSKRRVIFIDLARALAVTFMLYGHTVSALLAPSYQTGTWFDIWQFQRGLTSCLFLLLSGFAFSIATARHWSSHTQLSPAQLKRARRFALFIALGYTLHSPVQQITQWGAVSDERWRAFFAVDVLQLIGVTFFGVQLLVLLTRTRGRFIAASLLLAAAIVLVTPAAWQVDWPQYVPLWVAGYLGPGIGSLFPLLPWSAYVLVGAVAGQVYSRWGAADLRRFANMALLLPGLLSVAIGYGLDSLPYRLFGTGPWQFVPPQFLIRTGACFLVMGAIAHASARLDRLPHVFGAVAQETLLIYFVHLCIIYGSIWNRGLVRIYGTELDPGQVLLIVVLLVASMVALASYWNWCKHSKPRLAKATMAGLAVAFILTLL